MFQMIGSLLALVAIVCALAGALATGTAFALFTFVWVVVAKPRPTRLVMDDAPRGVVYELRFAR